MAQRYSVYEADRAGCVSTVLITESPSMVVKLLRDLRAKNNGRAYGVTDPDDEERGDIEEQAEEAALNDEPKITADEMKAAPREMTLDDMVGFFRGAGLRVITFDEDGPKEVK
jgi:hypothetical protein